MKTQSSTSNNGSILYRIQRRHRLHAITLLMVLLGLVFFLNGSASGALLRIEVQGSTSDEYGVMKATANGYVILGTNGNNVFDPWTLVPLIYIDAVPNQLYDVLFEDLTGNNIDEAIILAQSESSCFEVFAQGVTWTNVPGTPTHTFKVGLKPKNVLFTWDGQDTDGPDGGYLLPADGESKAVPSARSSSIPISSMTWDILEPKLGAQIDSTTGVVTAGTNSGTITVTASSGGVCYEKRLHLLDCATCLSGFCSAFGALIPGLASIDLKVNLGWSVQGGSAGYLWIKEEAPHNQIATPSSLHYGFGKSDTDFVTNSWGTLKQVKTSQGLANIVTNTLTKYTIDLYMATNVLAKTNGLYPLLNSPLRRITVENPSGDTNQVWVTDSDNAHVFKYSWLGDGWELESGSGLRKESKTTAWSETNTLRTVTTAVMNSDDTVVHQTIEKRKRYSYGERLLSQVIGSGSGSLTNTFTYTANGYLEQAIRGDGTWEYSFYDAQNRPTNVFSGFKNQTVTTNANLCRSLFHDYLTNSISGAGDTGYLSVEKPRRTIEYLLGEEVGRTYRVVLPGIETVYQCPTPGASYADAENLITVTTYYTNGLHQSRIKSITRPDGTATIYDYGTNSLGSSGRITSLTDVVWEGHPQGGTNVDNGTKTTLAYGTTGEFLSREVLDIPSNIVMVDETYSYDGQRRLTNTIHLDGTSHSTVYGCCTISSENGRDGSSTTYSYDALQRRTTATRNSIISSNSLDAAGNILSNSRIGSTTIRQRSALYDTAGRITYSTNALGGVTTFTYALGSGGRTNTITNPDGGQRIEIFYLDGYLREVQGSATNPTRFDYGVAAEDGDDRFYEEETKLDESGNATAETQTRFFDGLNRQYRTEFAAASGTPYRQSFYNNLGQLERERDPDGVNTLYTYNNKGQREITAISYDRDTSIDLSNDRITKSISDVINTNSVDIVRTRTYQSFTSGSATSNLVHELHVSTDGLKSWDITLSSATNKTVTSYPGSGKQLLIQTAPDGSGIVTSNYYDRVQFIARTNASGSQISRTTFGYDSHGRQTSATDARNGTTTTGYNDADQPSSNTTPIPGTGERAQPTTYTYNSSGRLTGSSLPDGGSVSYAYQPSGELVATSGTRTYPVGYNYDTQSRLTQMTNWTAFASAGARVTTWNYETNRGFLENKRYPDSTGPDYGYTPGGRLYTRAWERGTTTTYATNGMGDLVGIDYSDSTPDVTYTLDRLGRRTGIETSGANGTESTLTYNDAGQLLSHTHTDGLLTGLSFVNTVDSVLRRSQFELKTNSTIVATHKFVYDTASQLSGVTNGSYSAGYSYLANSPLVEQMAFKQSSTTRLTTTRNFDLLNRLRGISSTPGSDSAVSFNYRYNNANQRVQTRHRDSSFWVYEYDDLGQVISGKKYWSDGTPVAGQQFEYAFDDIGNRISIEAGGDFQGGSLRSHSYSVNNLNQYTSRSVTGAVDVVGIANASATVQVNAQSNIYRRGEYYQIALSFTNSSVALYPGITNWAWIAPTTNTQSGNVFIPKTPEIFGYDADGNMTNDGRWTITWDGENRLSAMESLSGGPVGSSNKLQFAYDDVGRRISKVVYNWIGSAWSKTNDLRFAYDGWNLVAELNTNGTVLRSYTWGTDLSGTMQGAGGVGGLVSMTVHTGANAGTYFYAYDGNANVAALVNAGDGTLAAEYEYDPFGNLIRSTGTLARENPFRFSTKYQDDETDWLYYGQRFYSPSLGRWANQDPIEEQGGMNLYCHIGNDPINGVDPLGFERLPATQQQSTLVKEAIIAIRQAGFTELSQKLLQKASAGEIVFDSSLASNEAGRTLPSDSTIIILNPTIFSSDYSTAHVDKLAETLSHEWVHTQQFSNLGSSVFFFSTSLFPELLGPGSLTEQMAYRLAAQVADAIKKLRTDSQGVKKPCP